MTIRQACFCGVTAILSLVGALVLLAVTLDVVSMPNPVEAVHYMHRHNSKLAAR